MTRGLRICDYKIVTENKISRLFRINSIVCVKNSSSCFYAKLTRKGGIILKLTIDQFLK